MMSEQTNAFRRFSHSIHKMLKVNKPSHPPQTGGRDQTSTNNNENVLNDDLAAFPDLLRDRQILTSNSLSDFRRTVILKREPTQSFGFSLQSVSIAKADDDRTGKFTYVSKVEIDSPADNAGILKGDVIIAVDGDRVVDYCHADLISLIQTKTQMRMIVIFENMARKVDLISKYNETEQLLAEKKKKLAEVNDQIEDILCRQDGSQGTGGQSCDGGIFLSGDDISEIASSRFSLKSAESFDFDANSVDC